jgi:hypothetical protein
MICPKCKKKLNNNGVGHIYHCDKLTNKEDVFINLIKLNFPNFIDKEWIQEHYVNQNRSLNSLKNEYKIPRKCLEKILLKQNFKLTNISEGVKRSREDSKMTCLKKYGVENPSQSLLIQEKKEKTFLKNYGTTNIFKHKFFLENVKKNIIEKYGITLNELRSIRSKEVWKNKTKEERDTWIEKTISNSVIKQRKGFVTSKGEREVSKILIDLGYSVQTPFLIQYEKKRYFSYDILLNDFNKIIEYNGDLIHANPIKYNEDDILTFPLVRKVKDIWIKDELKKEIALTKGYEVIVIWESDFKKNKFKQKDYIKNFLKSYGIEN